jgi:hypothetical protein
MFVDHPILSKISAKILQLRTVLCEKRALDRLKENDILWHELNSYLTKTKSIGCSYSDYWELYRFVLSRKPMDILECGTGASTIVLAHALMQNERDYGVSGRIVSMEEDEEWYKMAHRLMPQSMKKYVEIVLSPVIEECYAIFRGVRYRDVPERPYDFVFIDGPKYIAPSDGTVSFDFDYIHVIMNSNKAVYAIVDKRLTTCYVLQKLFGVEKVKYSVKHHLCFVSPCTRDDLRVIDSHTPSSCFSHSFRLFGVTRLDLKMQRPR